MVEPEIESDFDYLLVLNLQANCSKFEPLKI